MNEKKILAISKMEFTQLVVSSMVEAENLMKNIPIDESNIDEYLELAFYIAKEALFDDKYVIGRKKCRRSGEDANGGINKTTTIFYHEKEDLSRGNEK